MANAPTTSSAQTSRSPGTARLAFTDGDTAKRFTIIDANVAVVGPVPLCQIVRDTIADNDDYGWQFTVNVSSISAGSFDVNVVAQSADSDPATGEAPNESVTLVYHLIS